jgi:hypothetical protein
MADQVATVPMNLWWSWLAEGGLAPTDGTTPEPWDGETESHFWLPALPRNVHAGDRLYIVAHGYVRGYAPVAYVEDVCRLNPHRACLVRRGGAVAVTPCPTGGRPMYVRGFQGARERWWPREVEQPFPHYQTHGVPR